ncbi:MAG: hypothetical protein QM534_13985 [Sediminibacterium sp.]|nr:hypothetical protein [Sediminibacterium sp.]
MKNRLDTCFKARPYTVKGGALYVAIFVSILITLFLSLMLLLSYQNGRTTIQYLQTGQLYTNLNSAFEMVQSAYFTETLNNRWLKNEFNDDSVRVRKSAWGAYWLVCAESKNRHQRVAQAGIYGMGMTPDTALMIVDNGRPLGVSGKVSFRGGCYLPKAGLKPAYIEGMSYQNDAQNNSYIRSGLFSIPEVSPAMLNALRSQKTLSYQSDSAVSFLADQCHHPFSKKTLVYECGSQRLTRKNWSDNLKIVSTSEVVVDSSCHFSNVLIVAKKVKFLKGFKGKVHVIASDSITAEEKCTFQYPSSLVIINEETAGTDNSTRTIFFHKECVFFGGILAITTGGTQSTSRVFVKLDGSSQYNGFIYSSDYVHLEGEVNATVISRALLLKTPSAVYENHIINCALNPSKWAHVLAIPPLFQKNTRLVCSQKINT